MAISVNRVKTYTKEGRTTGVIQELIEKKNEEINFKGTMTTKDILEVKIKAKDGTDLTARMIEILMEGSMLWKMTESVIGEIPYRIDNLEKLLEGKTVGVEVKNKRKNGKTYSNVVDFFPASEIEQEDEDYMEDVYENVPNDEENEYAAERVADEEVGYNTQETAARKVKPAPKRPTPKTSNGTVAGVASAPRKRKITPNGIPKKVTPVTDEEGVLAD